MNDLTHLPTSVHTRWASAENPAAAAGRGGAAGGGRKGAACIRDFTAHASAVIARAEGTSGCIRRIWITIMERTPSTMRGLRIRFFWDGAAKPAIDCPLGDFFCNGLAQSTAFENEWFSNPEGRSFVCLLPMPFRSGMRVEVSNETGRNIESFFYEIDFTIGDEVGSDVGYLHAYWCRETKSAIGEDYTFLPTVVGRGRFLGVCFSVMPDSSAYGRTWWGEGEVKGFIDGDGDLPTLCGTGTEDYIGTGWCLGRYANRWQGCTVADEQRFRYAFYRLHGPDPIYFHERIRLTIQRIGWMHPEQALHMRASGAPFKMLHNPSLDLDQPGTWARGIFERAGDDWSSCSWFYLDRPENNLPELSSAAERIAGLS